jgi:hypothetical protein
VGGVVVAEPEKKVMAEKKGVGGQIHLFPIK